MTKTQTKRNKILYNKTSVQQNRANKMKTKADYYALQAEIDAIAAKYDHAYLTDEGVDAENCLPLSWDDGNEFWIQMYESLRTSAGMRAEELGIDLNKELGRIIY